MTGSEHLDKLFDKPAAKRRTRSLPPVSRTVLIRTGACLAALVVVVALVIVVVVHSGSVLTDLALLAPLLLVLAVLPAVVIAVMRRRTRHLPSTPHPNTNNRKGPVR